MFIEEKFIIKKKGRDSTASSSNSDVAIGKRMYLRGKFLGKVSNKCPEEAGDVTMYQNRVASPNVMSS